MGRKFWSDLGLQFRVILRWINKHSIDFYDLLSYNLVKHDLLNCK